MPRGHSADVKILRQSDRDRALIVTGGVTLAEALAACDQLRIDGLTVRIIDLFSIQPIDREALIAASRAVGGVVITVERSLCARRSRRRGARRAGLKNASRSINSR